MKIIQVSNSDIQGGAARAAYRLHRGLIAVRQDSQLLVLDRRSPDQTVLKLEHFPADPHTRFLSTIQKRYINQNRALLSNTSFSLPYPGIDLVSLDAIAKADIINLHWVAYFQSPATLRRLLTRKPVVWTLHDMWAFTGGCHYSAGCTQYQQGCAHCPQLQADPYGLTAAVLQERLDLLSDTPLVIVTPSQWLAHCVKQSRVLRNQRIEVIPYSLETDVFSPLNRAEAKQALGLEAGAIALLIGADNGNERRKGFAELLQALHLCRQNSQFQALLAAQKFQLWCFGIPNGQLTELNLPLHSFGRIGSDAQLRQIYAAADLFALPSLEDNFPNTMLEAMSCGTPVVAFEVGGIPDVVKNGMTGWTVPLGDISAMAAAILEGIFADDLREQRGQASRQLMAEQYALTVQAQRYLDLYENLIQNPPNQHAGREEGAMGKSFEKVFYPLALKFAAEELQAARRQARQQLERSQAEAQTLRDRLTAIETSKFWKLRTLWFKLKRWLGLSVDQE
ncbi:MAG: glycosyltransferase [Leptolyngbyaceae cyanobacterium CSU_1_4]|nr:glycosyltransferase [Leptolyngbyaceae cyanobacterium CSU_1_4]